MKHSCAFFSIVSYLLVSLCFGSRLMAASLDTVSDSPTEVPLIAFVWQDLFDETFDAGEDSMFILFDKPVSTSFGNGYELAVLNFDGSGDADNEYDGAVFIEESRYPDAEFPEQSGFVQGDYNGTLVTVRWRFWLDTVAGRIVNATGQSRIVAAYVYVCDFEGIGAYEGGGFRLDNLVPVRRTFSLSAADNHAFKLSGLETPRADIQNCANIDPSDFCALKLCQCENRIANRLDDDLADCGWGPVSWGASSLCAGVGASAGIKAGWK